MVASAFMGRVITAVNNAQTAQAQAVMYGPLLEFIIEQVFLACSTDVAIAAADQTAFLNAYNLSQSDPSA